MFHNMCKWIVNNASELPQENEILFHLLKENEKGGIVLEGSKITKIIFRDSKGGNSHSIAEHCWKSQLMQESITKLIETRLNEIYDLFMQENTQVQTSSRSLQKDRLDLMIDYWWKLMQFSKESYNIIHETVHCRVELKVRNDECKYSGTLQHKVWNPGRVQLKRHEDNAAYGQQ